MTPFNLRNYLFNRPCICPCMPVHARAYKKSLCTVCTVCTCNIHNSISESMKSYARFARACTGYARALFKKPCKPQTLIYYILIYPFAGVCTLCTGIYNTHTKERGYNGSVISYTRVYPCDLCIEWCYE